MFSLASVYKHRRVNIMQQKLISNKVTEIYIFAAAMKCSVLIFFIFGLLFFVSNGQVLVEPSDNIPDHPGYCYSEKEGVGAMERGEVKTQKGKCLEIECLEHGYIQYSGCHPVAIPGRCKYIPEDLSKPYPDCCPDVKC
ncbi:hypothetical protein ILUMI_11797 [Ignelater luminosus]|uniref:Single domain-containing protein n=1 Tax=Ignelater luminosus TaxID=2038154 RepID=A0A8K0CVK5_IGNLU|nr:hypothetical protein ILUMI_11797 [Ignelater luminosus]